MSARAPQSRLIAFDPLQELKLEEAAKKVETGIEETFVYMDFPYTNCQKIRTNNVIERLNRKIRRRTRVVGAFPDGNSALMLVCARLSHVASTAWGMKRNTSNHAAQAKGMISRIGTPTSRAYSQVFAVPPSCPS